MISQARTKTGGFKTWMRAIALILVVVFTPQQIAWAVDYDWRSIWRSSQIQPAGAAGAASVALSQAYLKSAGFEKQVAFNIKESLESLRRSNSPSIQFSNNVTVQRASSKPITKEEITNAYNKLVDSCEGEIVDYNSAIRQARLIVDNDFCRQQCEIGKKPGDDIECDDVCNTGIAVPWYIQGARHNGGSYTFPSLSSFAGVYETNDTWEFPNIENLFVMPVTGKRVPAMGLQQDSTLQTVTDFAMQKTEDNAGISTTDDVYWNTTTTRTFLYNDHLDKTSGTVQQPIDLQTDDYSTTRAEQGSTTWQTEW